MTTTPMLLAFFLSLSPGYLLYFVPLWVAISVVFGATRHEDPDEIRRHSIYTARWIGTFMLVIFLALSLVDWWV
ncbi:MAG: hypothetical protein AAF958_00910 [Planctomycetota bacterium]